jgi:hypothetical protein
MEWTAYLGFAKRPNATDTFTFSTGPRVWSIRLGELPWKQYRGISNKEFVWYGAQASVTLTVSDPDWVVVRSARLLPLVDANQYILETVVENLSPIPVPLSYLHLALAHPRDNRNSCALADPQVTLTLAWERILSQREESAEPSAWAQIGKSTIRVDNRARLDGGCSDFSFFAVVPVDVDVAPKTLERIDVKIVDLPSPTRPGVPRDRVPPHAVDQPKDAGFGLTGWNHMAVGVGGALPSSVVVDRRTK